MNATRSRLVTVLASAILTVLVRVGVGEVTPELALEVRSWVVYTLELLLYIGFTAARANLAAVLYRQNRPAEAVQVLDGLLRGEPDNAGAASLKAAALGRIGGYDEAILVY